MANFDDLSTNPRFAGLAKVPDCRLATMRHRFPGIPDDYVQFLSEVGSGDIGPGDFMLYDGLVEPRSIYGTVGKELNHLHLFGDDFQGFCFGFDPGDKWAVVEVDPSDHSIARVASTFEGYIKDNLA